ncbi:MAG: hypothetical protein HY615_05840 [Candidatus Rokubacteria bacterium]|nr:hypothetical protein [Candidatus Rokubacteria bacterium]
MHPRARRAIVALVLAVLVFAAGVCLADAAGHHADGTAQCCAALLALAALTAPLALGAAGRVAPLAVGGLPALALDLRAPPPEA